jgi:uncharacterized YccA/Bax inhibitor family protein
MAGEQDMTLEAVTKKAAFLILCMMTAAVFTWGLSMQILHDTMVTRFFTTLLLISVLLLAIVTLLKKTWATATAPAMALMSGAILAVCTLGPWERYPEVSAPVLALSFGPLLVTLLAHNCGLAGARNKTKLRLVGAVGGTLFACVGLLGLSLLGIPMSVGSLTLEGILLMVLAPVAILVEQFVGIEGRAESGEPKSMEWYEGLRLLVPPFAFCMILIRLFDTAPVPFWDMQTY